MRETNRQSKSIKYTLSTRKDEIEIIQFWQTDFPNIDLMKKKLNVGRRI